MIVTISGAQTRVGPFLYADEAHCIATYNSAILTYSVEPPSPEYLAAWAAAMGRLVGRSSVPISVVTIIDSRTKAPSETSKRAIRSTIVSYCDHICSFAYVVEGHGFGAAAMRSTLSLISLAARYPFPQKVFANVNQAAIWVVRTMPNAEKANINPTGIVSVAEKMRGAVGQLPAAVG